MTVADIPPGCMKRVDAGDRSICLVHALDGNVYAIDDVCPHEHASLSEGDLDGTEVECPLHSSIFDVRTGAVSGPPAMDPVATYPVTRDGDGIYVHIEAEQSV